jgi:hypothetical protein
MFGIVHQNYVASATFSIYHVNLSAVLGNKTHALDKDWLGELTDDFHGGVAMWPTCLELRGHFLMCVV